MIPLQFIQYAVPGRIAFLTNVPMGRLWEVRKLYRIAGRTIKVRYRGPRAGDLGRSPATRQASCLKSKAVTFSVYG
jgi:hypothetical protein